MIPIFLRNFAAELRTKAAPADLSVSPERAFRASKSLCFSISLPGMSAVEPWELREAVTAASCCPAHERAVPGSYWGMQCDDAPAIGAEW